MDAENFLNQLARQIQDLVQWVVVPLTMAWLAGRWLFLNLDSVSKDPAERERLTRLSRTGWITGLLFAVLLFACLGFPGTPVAATLWKQMQLEKYPHETCRVWWRAAAVAVGVLLGCSCLGWVFIRRRTGAPGSFWKRVIDGELLLSTSLGCGLGIFSLLSYFLWRESNDILFAGFAGLLLGYRLARLIEVYL
jgi:hypothetical protein